MACPRNSVAGHSCHYVEEDLRASANFFYP